MKCPLLRNSTERSRATRCCSVLQCVAACCSVLQCVAACCRVLQKDEMLTVEELNEAFKGEKV